MNLISTYIVIVTKLLLLMIQQVNASIEQDQPTEVNFKIQNQKKQPEIAMNNDEELKKHLKESNNEFKISKVSKNVKKDSIQMIDASVVDNDNDMTEKKKKTHIKNTWKWMKKNKKALILSMLGGGMYYLGWNWWNKNEQEKEEKPDKTIIIPGGKAEGGNGGIFQNPFPILPNGLKGKQQLPSNSIDITKIWLIMGGIVVITILVVGYIVLNMMNNQDDEQWQLEQWQTDKCVRRQGNKRKHRYGGREPRSRNKKRNTNKGHHRKHRKG